MKAEDFLAFRPLGWTSPPTHVFPAKHSSFSLALPGQDPPVRPVVFPGDAWVTAVNSTKWPDGRMGYQLYFQPCREFSAYLYHLSGLSDALLKELDKGQQTCRTYDAGGGSMVTLCSVRTAVQVRAGDPAGLSGDAAGVDFGAVDYRTPPLPFANSAHYSPELLHYVSPVVYFSAESRRVLESKLGSYDGVVRRTKEPLVGEVAQDVAGAAQGNWFTPGLNWAMTPPPDPNPFIALVHDYVDPSEPVFSVGASVPGLVSGVYSFTPLGDGKINRDFSAVTADGSVYCYDHFLTSKSAGGIGLRVPGGVVLLAMPDAQTLRLERQGSPGDMCAGLGQWRMTDQALTFVR